MNVSQLLNALALRPHIKVVETCLPETIRVPRSRKIGETWGTPYGESSRFPNGDARFKQTPPKCDLDPLNYGREIPPLRFADKQMEVLRHDNITENDEMISAARRFQNSQEKITTAGITEEWPTLIATRCNEVQIA